MLSSTPTHRRWLHVLISYLFLFQSVEALPDTQYNTFYPAIYLSDAQPVAASPPPTPAPPATSSEPSSPSLISPGSAPYSPAVPPVCPVNNLSCDGIGEPSWCCTSSQRCAFDDSGDVACCPLGDFCKGTVNYGAGGGSGTGGGATSGGTGAGGLTAGGETGSTATMYQGGATEGVETAGEGAVLWHSNARRSLRGLGYMKLMGLVAVAFVSGVVAW